MRENTNEIRFCPFCPICFGRLYLVISTPMRWVHTATDTKACQELTV